MVLNKYVFTKERAPSLSTYAEWFIWFLTPDLSLDLAINCTLSVDRSLIFSSMDICTTSVGAKYKIQTVLNSREYY